MQRCRYVCVYVGVYIYDTMCVYVYALYNLRYIGYVVKVLHGVMQWELGSK